MNSLAILVSANAQQKAANKQADLMTQQEQQAQNAHSLQMNQEASAAAQQMNERTKAARDEAAAFATAAGEYGGGVSIDRGASAITAAKNNDLSSIATNRDNTLAQIGQDARASGTRYQAGLASLSRPNRLGIALQIGGEYARAASQAVKPNPKP